MKPSSLVDTRAIYCGDCLDQLRRLPDQCVDLIYIDPPFNSNRHYEVFWGETKEKRSFEDRHASTQAYIEFMRPRCVELVRVLKPTGSFYYHCDWHASHYVKVMRINCSEKTSFKTKSSGSGRARAVIRTDTTPSMTRSFFSPRADLTRGITNTNRTIPTTLKSFIHTLTRTVDGGSGAI